MTPETHQRSRGRLALSWKRRGPDTVLDGLHQEGCLKARFPRAPAWAEAVLLNTAGGVAGGDALSFRIAAGPGTQATIASQAAERFYRALPGTTAQVDGQLGVAEGAALEWLPQETILFDRCALRRRLTVALHPSAWFLGVEQLVFGRTAMGETVHEARLHDLIRIERGGVCVLHDAIRFDGPVQSVLAGPASAAGGRAVATLIHAAADAPGRLDPLRAALAGFDAGASVVEGVLIARIVAANGACLRAAVVAGLAVLRAGRPLPRVWEC